MDEDKVDADVTSASAPIESAPAPPDDGPVDGHAHAALTVALPMVMPVPVPVPVPSELPPPYEAVSVAVSPSLPGQRHLDNASANANATGTPQPEVAIGSVLDIFHPVMSHVTSTLFFKQQSVVEIERMTMFKVHNQEDRLLFTVSLRRIPTAVLVSRRYGTMRIQEFNTEYTVSDTRGQTVLIGFSEKNSMRVTTGDRERRSIGFINDGGTEGQSYTATTTAGVGTFTLRRSFSALLDCFIIMCNGAKGLMIRRAANANCLPSHANLFAIEFPSTQLDSRLKALMFASGLHIYDSYFMRTTDGDGGVVGAHGSRSMKRACVSFIGLIIAIGIAVVIFLNSRNSF